MSRQWLAIYTKPRSEKKVAERLQAKSIEVYCPLQTVVRQWSDRKKKVVIPIFPSYVFVHVEEQERREVLMDPSVLNFVFYLGKPAVIKPYEIETIQFFLGEFKNQDYDISIFDYKKGDHVDIVAGPLKGMEGEIEIVEKNSVKLLIQSLGAIIKVDIKKHYLL